MGLSTILMAMAVTMCVHTAAAAPDIIATFDGNDYVHCGALTARVEWNGNHNLVYRKSDHQSCPAIDASVDTVIVNELVPAPRHELIELTVEPGDTYRFRCTHHCNNGAYFSVTCPGLGLRRQVDEDIESDSTDEDLAASLSDHRYCRDYTALTGFIPGGPYRCSDLLGWGHCREPDVAYPPSGVPTECSATPEGKAFRQNAKEQLGGTVEDHECTSECFEGDDGIGWCSTGPYPYSWMCCKNPVAYHEASLAELAVMVACGESGNLKCITDGWMQGGLRSSAEVADLASATESAVSYFARQFSEVPNMSYLQNIRRVYWNGTFEDAMRIKFDRGMHQQLPGILAEMEALAESRFNPKLDDARQKVEHAEAAVLDLAGTTDQLDF